MPIEKSIETRCGEAQKTNEKEAGEKTTKNRTQQQTAAAACENEYLHFQQANESKNFLKKLFCIFFYLAIFLIKVEFSLKFA